MDTTFCRDFLLGSGGRGLGSLNFSRRDSKHSFTQRVSSRPEYPGSAAMLIPCIDLQNRIAVQVIHGREQQLAINDVCGVLEKFKNYEWLHIIDLDAAMGETSNAKLAQKLCSTARSSYGMKVRAGGGIRTVSREVKVAGGWPEKIIIGSAVSRERKLTLPFLKQLVKRLDPGRIVIALDTA